MQECGSCRREVAPDMFFCAWCRQYLGSIGKGTKANIFARWVAWVIDPGIALLAWGIATGVLAAISHDLGAACAMLFPVAYFIWFLTLLRKGLTPGKLLLGLQVVDQQTGEIPGFGKMFLREIIGRFLSGLFLGIGYLWALFDKNGQAWHDKLAGTVVLRRSQGEYTRANRASA
ncbi:MAG TPA: RDD family protein [Bryobacteraceae bacterium]|nr:RDD family protein [Bryobacteraceae bacterium]